MQVQRLGKPTNSIGRVISGPISLKKSIEPPGTWPVDNCLTYSCYDLKLILGTCNPSRLGKLERNLTWHAAAVSVTSFGSLCYSFWIQGSSSRSANCCSISTARPTKSRSCSSSTSSAKWTNYAEDSTTTGVSGHPPYWYGRPIEHYDRVHDLFGHEWLVIQTSFYFIRTVETVGIDRELLNWWLVFLFIDFFRFQNLGREPRKVRFSVLVDRIVHVWIWCVLFECFMWTMSVYWRTRWPGIITFYNSN